MCPKNTRAQALIRNATFSKFFTNLGVQSPTGQKLKYMDIFHFVTS